MPNHCLDAFVESPIQQEGGTRRTIEQGRAWIADARQRLSGVPRARIDVSDLIVGTICGDDTIFVATPAAGEAGRVAAQLDAMRSGQA